MTYFERMVKINHGRNRSGHTGIGVLNYYDLLAQANLQSCDPRDSTCVANNVAKQAEVEDYWVAHQATGVPEGTKLTFTPLSQVQVIQFANPDPLMGGNVVSPNPITVTYPTPIINNPPPVINDLPVTAVVLAAPTVEILNVTKGTDATHGGMFYVGDRWRIMVSAKSGSYISASSVKNGSSNETSNMGTVPNSGVFVLDGIMGQDTLGTWSESWYADNILAGQLTFTVATPVSNTNAGSGTGTGTGGNTGNTTNTSTYDSNPVVVSWFVESMIGGIPNWALVGGGALVLFMITRRR